MYPKYAAEAYIKIYLYIYVNVICSSLLFNDRFCLSFFVAKHGFRESDFDYYSISYSSTHKSRPNVSMRVY